MNISARVMATSLIACAAFCTSTVADAAIYVKIPGVGGDVLGPDGERDWFVADSFSFGVEREMKESGEKGGTADINIGVGELQECTISKSMDAASAGLAHFAWSGRNPGDATICFSNRTDNPRPGSTASEGTPVCYLKYKLDRAFVRGWSTSGDADDRPTEEVAFYFSKIAFGYETESPEGAPSTASMGWDNVKNTEWGSGARDALDGVAGPPPPPLRD